MREFQPAQEPVSATIGPSVTNQSDFRAQADRNGAKPEVPANGQGASPGRPAWAALLEPGVTNAPVAPPSGQAAAPFPGLGKTQAGNLLASLASQSAVPGAAAAAAQVSGPGPSSLAGQPSPADPSPVPVSPSVASRVAVPAVPAVPTVPTVSTVPAGQPGQAARPAAGIQPVAAPSQMPVPQGLSAPASAAATSVASAGVPSDEESAVPGPHGDDIIPLKPRPSARLRPGFRLSLPTLPTPGEWLARRRGTGS